MVEEGAPRPARNRLQLDASHAVRILTDQDGVHRAEPVTLVAGQWAHSVPGDGAGLAVLHRLRNRMAVEEGFRVTTVSWTALDGESERAMGVDQTNESWVVGERVVVKWVTDALDGPHPGPERLRRLAEVGFDATPPLVGLLEWQNPSGDWAPVAIVSEHLPGAEDGWTWAVTEARRALGVEDGPVSPFAEDLGELTGRLHVVLRAGSLTPDLAHAQADDARATVDASVRLTSVPDPASHALLVDRRPDIEAALTALDGLAGSAAVQVHGDYHVGQVLRTPDGTLHVIDFDGNPTRPAHLRAAPGPAARDVAGMLVSLENVAHVVCHYAPSVSEERAAAWTAGVQGEFLTGYRRGLAEHSDLYDEKLVPAFDWEQVCREFIYAAKFLPRWGYVPAAALRRRTKDV